MYQSPSLHLFCLICAFDFFFAVLNIVVFVCILENQSQWYVHDIVRSPHRIEHLTSEGGAPGERAAVRCVEASDIIKSLEPGPTSN